MKVDHISKFQLIYQVLMLYSVSPRRLGILVHFTPVFGTYELLKIYLSKTKYRAPVSPSLIFQITTRWRARPRKLSTLLANFCGAINTKHREVTNNLIN